MCVCVCVVTRSMSVFSCSSLDGAECIRPSSVPMSSSPLGDRTSCWMMSRACSRHWRYFTMLWTQRAPPNSLNSAGRQTENGGRHLASAHLNVLTEHSDTRPGYNEYTVTKQAMSNNVSERLLRNTLHRCWLDILLLFIQAFAVRVTKVWNTQVVLFKITSYYTL